MEIKWISTTENEKWKTNKIIEKALGIETLELTGEQDQIMEGFGGCFNELGWKAISVPEESEKEILEA